MILIVICNLPAIASESENSKSSIDDDLQLLGIIDPEGEKSVWLVSSAGDGTVAGIISKYSARMIDGIKFYELYSWQDTALFLTAVNKQQAQTMQQLTQDIQKLNRRVKALEKRKRVVVSSGSLNSRVKALEKKVEYMSDGGLP